tara:strand:+ start:406 stop:1002 length:597 start_codon:yes stop_codon:yes gene_type:complete
MERFFKIIPYFNKDINKDTFQNIVTYCQEIDNLINKKFNFGGKNKEYDLKVKYLIKNFTFPTINIFSKIIKNKKYHTLTHSKQLKLEHIFGLIIFGPHCIVMNHTMPIYIATPYHKNIYNLCKKIDTLIYKSDDREIYYFFLNNLFNFLNDIQDNIFHKVEEKRIKILYGKKTNINLHNKLMMKKQLEQELKQYKINK